MTKLMKMVDGVVMEMTPAEVETWQETCRLATVSAAERLQSEITDCVQDRLDKWAQTRGYDNILSAASYATSKVPRFAAEGQAAVDGRDQTWSMSHDILEAVKGGNRPMPSSYAEIEPELPVLAWPDSL